MTITAPTKYETVIGLEVHVQLKTRSKMFCSCRSDYQGAKPNSLVCPVCLGMPGVLPVINKKAVEYAIATGLALNCNIARLTKFDRKNYAYPDLMKGYQISQYDMPIAYGGHLDVETNGGKRTIGITRVHMEEDVAKLTHVRNSTGETFSLVDVNRSGVPLMEIVSEPDIRSPEEARQYLTTLRSILRYIGVSTGNMEEGNFRCDANVSIRPMGSSELSTRTEVKNMNSFRSVFSALEYEVERQRRMVEDGGRVVQETRGWVEDRAVTVSQRSKEHAHDYRYFPEPDLPELLPDPAWVAEIRASLPELPAQRRDRFVSQYGLPLYDAGLLSASRSSAEFFEEAVGGNNGKTKAIQRGAKRVSNWMLGEVSRLLDEGLSSIDRSRLKPAHLGELSDLVESGDLSSSLAKTVLQKAFETGKSPKLIVKDEGYEQISDSSVVEQAIHEAIDQNPKAVQDYLGGRESASKFLFGQVMRITRGKANPAVVNKLMQLKLNNLQNTNGSA